MGFISLTLCLIVSVVTAYFARRLFHLGTLGYFSFLAISMLLLYYISSQIASWWQVTKAESLDDIISSLDLKSGDIMLDTKNGFRMMTQHDVQSGDSASDALDAQGVAL